MGQNIYSLLLQECLVEAVDAMAEEKQMSRSQVINEILAERFEMYTPEYKIIQIMDVIKERLSANEKLNMISFSKGSSLQYKMVVPYKYNPKIKLMLILNSRDLKNVATLKISSRTTNQKFLDDLWQYFDHVNKVTEEHGRLKEYPMLKGTYFKKNDGILKDFPLMWIDDQYTIEEISRQVTNYLYMLSEAMVGYFNHLGDQTGGHDEIERVIHKYF